MARTHVVSHKQETTKQCRIYYTLVKMHENISKSPCMHAQICLTNNEPSRRYFSNSSVDKNTFYFSSERINTCKKSTKQRRIYYTQLVSMPQTCF